MRRDRGDVDDRALALALHDRHDLPADQIDALEVDVVDEVPVGLLGGDDAAGARDADVVDQHVDPAERRHAGLDHGLDAVGFGDVGRMGRADAALALDDAPGLVGRREVEVDREYVGPLAREQHGGRLAIAPARADRARAGDQRHLAVEPPGHVRLPLVFRPRKDASHGIAAQSRRPSHVERSGSENAYGSDGDGGQPQRDAHDEQAERAEHPPVPGWASRATPTWARR